MNTTRSKFQNKLHLFLTFALMAALFGLGVTLSPGPQDVMAQSSTESSLTSNEMAANGPIPGDLGLVADEWDCSQQLDTPGYFKSINAAEVADATRSQLYPCASFTGSFTVTGSYSETNQVFAYRFPAENEYYGVLFINNRRPGELYLSGGNNPPGTGPVPPGPFVAKVDATTGQQYWRTILENANVSGAWVGASNLNILEDGTIVIAVGNALYKLSGETGLIMQQVDLPTGQAPAAGSNHKHVTIAPDGTLIVKNQTRATPCDIQGTLALFQCPGGVEASPPANIAAVDPDTFEILDNIDVPENTAVPHTITTLNDGRIAIYAPGVTTAFRFIWDPDSQTLSQDTDWVQPNYLDEGQTTGDAPGILGDWIILQVNGLPTTDAASAIVAINQYDPTNITRVYPFGTDLPTGQSWAPPKAAIDSDNNMIFSTDQNMGMMAGISMDLDSGEMTTEWTLEGSNTALQALYGPADQRVLGTARAEPGTTLDELNNTADATYGQSALWLNAATGEVLAESDYFTPPMGFNTMLTPGFGGRFYYPTTEGIIVFQVMPVATDSAATDDSATAASTSDAGDTADIPEGWTSPQSMTSAMGPTYTLTPDSLTDARGYIYCELVFNYGDSGSDIYSTSPVAPCDLDWWDGLDLDSLAAELNAESVNKNGPEWWSMDTVQEMTSEPTTVGGIEMVYGAVLPPGTMTTPQYEVFNTAKYQYLIYEAGQPTYQLVDPDGVAYVLQGYKVDQDQLANLGDQFQNLPEGWSYQVVTPDEDLVLNLTPAAPIPSVQDEFDQIYIQIPGQ